MRKMNSGRWQSSIITSSSLVFLSREAAISPWGSQDIPREPLVKIE